MSSAAPWNLPTCPKVSVAICTFPRSGSVLALGSQLLSWARHYPVRQTLEEGRASRLGSGRNRNEEHRIPVPGAGTRRSTMGATYVRWRIDLTRTLESSRSHLVMHHPNP